MQPTRDEVRTRFLAFAGEDQFQKFVGQIHRFATHRGRLRFWQEKLWSAFLAENHDCTMNHNELCAAFRICEVHGRELQSKSVPVVNGCVDYSGEYINDRVRFFPHATLEFVSTEGVPMNLSFANIFYCNECDVVQEASRWRTETGHKVSNRLEEDRQGLARALEVSRIGIRTKVSEGDTKLLGFFLRHGECDARIAVPVIEVRFSWLENWKPSTYFLGQGPGLVSQLMDLGGVDSIVNATEFSVGPGNAGTGIYKFSFVKKWIWIHCADDEIRIRVRDQRGNLNIPLRNGF